MAKRVNPVRKVGNDIVQPPNNPTRQIGNDIVRPPVTGLQSIGTKTSDGYYDNWALSKFSFVVDIGGFSGEVAFQGVDGLGATVASMKFRDGNSSNFFEESRPTLTTYEPVTLKKGTFIGDSTLFDWFKNVSEGYLFSDMRTVNITLCELGGGGVLNYHFRWTLDRAYVTKFTPSSMDAESDAEIAIEEIELTYQSFQLNAGGFSIGGLISAILG